MRQINPAAFLAFAAVGTAAIVAAYAQPELVGPATPVRIVAGGGVATPARENVIRAQHVPWGTPYDLWGTDTLIIGAPQSWEHDGNGSTVSVVYVDGVQYPVLRLYLGPTDPPLTAQEKQERTAAWSAGWLWCQAQPKTGAVVEWWPRDAAGNVIDPASWGWSNPQ